MTDDDRTRLLRLRQAQEKAKTQAGGPKYPLMSQLNAGIASSVGGAVDFLNPFDRQTGSAVSGLEGLMGSAGIEVAQDAPDTIMEGVFRGAGEAAGSAPTIALGLKALTGAGGMVGQFSDDILRVLGTKAGTAGEVVAGGVSGGAREGAKQAGAGPVGQDMAAILAPMSVPAIASLVRAAAVYGPTGTIVRQLTRQLAPFTKAGAKGVATQRMQELAGSPERAEELANMTRGENPLNLTPAQQTGDPNMLGIERLATEQDPVLREAIDARRTQSATTAQTEVEGMGGNVEDAQQFFADRRRAFAQDLQARADAALQGSADDVQGIASTRTPGENSELAYRQVTRALNDAVAEEKALWAKVDNSATVGTSNAKSKAQQLVDEVPFAQRNDIPRAVRELLDAPEVYGESATVRDMHGLYSELRRVARSAMAGNDQNKNMARVANNVADAILADLGAVDGATAIGRQINEARAFSAALHETFDRGAPGRILKRTIDGDQAIDPELALQRTVGRQGTEASVTSRQLEGAGVRPNVIQDYIAGQFSEVAINQGTGEVTMAGAQRWLSRNRELLSRYPELRDEVTRAVSGRLNAEQMAARVSSRISALEDTRRSATAQFIGGQAEKAYRAITDAANPVQAARKIANEARKDKSGKALAGLKGALTNHIINSSMKTASAETSLDATSLARVLETPQLKRAMGQIFSADEMMRMQTLSRELAKAQSTQAANVGDSLSGASAPRWLQMVAQVAGAKVAVGAANARNAGVALQAANLGSNRARDLVQRLTADRASQMIADAITDPELFRALLTQSGSVRATERALPKFIPYLIGGASVAANEE